MTLKDIMQSLPQRTIETKKSYNVGVKDILMFWKWGGLNETP